MHINSQANHTNRSRAIRVGSCAGFWVDLFFGCPVALVAVVQNISYQNKSCSECQQDVRKINKQTDRQIKRQTDRHENF